MQWFDLSDPINLISVIAAIVIIGLTAFVSNFYINKMKTSNPKGELSSDRWDGIGKFENNIPFGWGICFALVMIWGFWYIFVGYPLNSFSQIGQYNQEVAEHNQKYQKKWENLSQNDLVAMGESIFLVQCSQCHGVTAEGLQGKAQNLTQWGKEEGIMQVIKNGSKGLDFPLGEMPVTEINESDARAVAAYVMAEISELKNTKYPAEVAKGKEVFSTAGCTACHGEDGRGMEGSAPDLSTYGTSKFLAYVLEHGKKGHIGHMPSFKFVQFNDVQIRALAAYIESLENVD
ncbi:cytochrome-c oxidase, cbb3-type subunit III [Helicobacter pametensis]|uniref:cytochrome-c oxidase, cbb3-type subunit III n=1 Tax=Helicobacter pametensis TaxID=95149 RepID=UPI0004828E49|nr:cytochrome-c oxidase, cbb3-type subunit III [Helicobacter pametensis]